MQLSKYSVDARFNDLIVASSSRYCSSVT